MKLRHTIEAILLSGLLFLGITSCVGIDNELGSNFIPSNQKYTIATFSIKLEDINLAMSDSLSGYSSENITIGAVRDDLYGLTTRGSAFTLIPSLDTMDFGTNTRFRQFHVSISKDTVSFRDPSQEHILQNVNVYALEKELDTTLVYVSSLSNNDFAGKQRITDGVPLYDGGDSLSFNLGREFAEHYMSVTQKELDSLELYSKRFPGIYLCVDDPIGNGGRINKLNLAVELNDSYYVTGNYAELKFTADYGDRKDVDTSFIYFFGATSKNIMSSSTGQYALNVSGHDTKSENLCGKATDRIYIEGGGGIKPMISAKYIKQIVEDKLAENGVTDFSRVIINKATIVLPYEYTAASYEELNTYPKILSPTCRIRSDSGSEKYVSYAGLTDSSISSENQGDIDRSNCCYSPDISHHVQSILRLADEDKFENYDVWFLIMSEEVVEGTSQSSNSYYDYLDYANYYNMLYDPYGYGYGYGSYGYGYGYGGYGGYGYYDNYLNYSYLMSMYSNSGSEETTVSVLDKDRYYSAILNGPQSENGPELKIVYSVLNM